MWNDGDRDRIMSWLGTAITAETLAHVQSKMDNLETLSPDAVSRVQGYITTLQSIDSQIELGRPNPAYPIAQVAVQGRRFVQNMAKTLGLEIARDVF